MPALIVSFGDPADICANSRANRAGLKTKACRQDKQCLIVGARDPGRSGDILTACSAYFGRGRATTSSARSNPIRGCVFGLLISRCHGVVAVIYQKCSQAARWFPNSVRDEYGSGYLVVATRVRGFYHGRKGKLFSIGMCVHSWNGYSLGYSLCAVRLIVVH